jgi:hypothetical protein
MRAAKMDAAELALLTPWWTLALPLIPLTGLLEGPPERHLWVAPFATVTFAAMQWVLPRCRLRTDHYLGPVNIALILFFIKLVVAPALVMLTGAESRVLSFLPSLDSMQAAVLIDVTAYVAFCLGLSCASLPEADRGGLPFGILSGPGPGRELIWACTLLGLAGFAAAFGSPGRLIEYFLDSDAELTNELEGSVEALAGTFLRPFLAFALVAWWARMVDSSSGGARFWRVTFAGLIAAVGVTLANMTFSFNRAAFVFPLTSLIAVYSVRVRRIPVGLTIALVAIALPVLMAIGTMRSSRMIGGDKNAGAFASVLQDASETVQAYSGGPQFSALLYERTGWGDRLYGGSTLVASVLSPVPLVGKGFRESSGPALFNQTIYHVRDIEDQILPLSTELFINFHLPGVVAGFIGLGILLARAQEWIQQVESTFAAFSIQYVAMWGAMLAAWSASIYSQILIYFFGPIYAFVAVSSLLKWLGKRSRRRTPVLPEREATV